MDYFREIGQDVRYAVRQLRRTPGFTAVATLTLALGIGATTAIFGTVHAVVLRPLPFDDAERLVRVYSTSLSTTASDEVSPKDFVAWRRESRSFARMAPIETRSLTMREGTSLPEPVTGVRTTSDFFPMLGVRPLLGRTFSAEEDEPGRAGVVVLSHRFWTSRFAGDSAIVGRAVRLDGEPFTVIAVMPASFDPPARDVQLWTPIAFTGEKAADSEIGYLDVIARLRPGVSVERAQADLAALVQRLDPRATSEQRSARVVGYLEDLVGHYRARLFVLLGAVALVLLIACVNVANLLLARGVTRWRELAIRSALGAGRGRVVRQLLTESVVLAGTGGAVGLALAYWLLRALKASSPDGVPRLDQASLDATAVGFALVVALASSVFFGLLPAVRVAGPGLQSALQEGGRSGAGVTRDRVRPTLVVIEVALSLVLLVGAGLLIRSAILTARVDPGLDPSNVWSAWITLPSAAYPTPERVTRAYERVLDGVHTVPGIERAAAISVAPFTGLRALGLFVPEGRPLDRANALMANLRLASPEVFETLRIPLRRGRAFTDRDDASAPEVVVVNEAFARLAWPGEDAIGKRLYGAGGSERGPIARQVVGVVGATHEDGLREDRRPAMYIPLRQVPPVLWQSVQNSMFIVARTAVDPAAVTRGIQDAVLAVDPGVPLNGVSSIEERMAESLATERFNTRLLTALGIVGLILAVVGIYGVIAYFVSQRAHEIGVRMALGATAADVVTLVVSQGLRPVGAGIALGAAGAGVATRLLAGQLYGVAATDPVAFATVVGLVAAAAVVAAALPARRAARVDPKRVLGS